MTTLLKTVFHHQHQDLGAKLVEFGGWEMPIQYPEGIISEHMATREKAGIFDVSHMGRLFLRGRDALPFLQHVLSNNAQALGVGQSQYTLIQNADGGAIDDAYLYRFKEDEYLLVVNASNREKDIAHLQQQTAPYPDLVMEDKTFDVAMISLQGPLSKTLIEQIIEQGYLPEPARNCLSIVTMVGSEVLLARTGYTGEPLGFELFADNKSARKIWDRLIALKAAPV
ncbi:MAG: glycine cleavage system protein T, partial [Desulfobulbus sp.]